MGVYRVLRSWGAKGLGLVGSRHGGGLAVVGVELVGSRGW